MDDKTTIWIRSIVVYVDGDVIDSKEFPSDSQCARLSQLVIVAQDWLTGLYGGVDWYYVPGLNPRFAKAIVETFRFLSEDRDKEAQVIIRYVPDGF